MSKMFEAYAVSHEVLDRIKKDSRFVDKHRAMGNGLQIPGSTEAQVVVVLMHRIRLLEEFILKIPFHGFIEDSCFLNAEEMDDHFRETLGYGKGEWLEEDEEA